MTRTRLIDFRNSNAATRIGLCYGNTNAIAREVSEAQRRLLMCKEAGEEGWFGTWAEIAFTLTQTAPYFTADRHIGRLEAANVCDRTIPINNQFFEYLRFGNGRMPKLRPWCQWGLRAAYQRNNVPTTIDLSPSPQFIAVYATDVADIEAGKRVFLQGPDNSGNFVYSQDNGVRVDGIFLTLTSPFIVSPNTFNAIAGIQKDQTNGPVQFWQMDPTTGAQVLLLTMEPGELVAGYRRYYFDKLPFACCPVPVPTAPVTPPLTPQPVQITAIAKLEPLPLMVDTDYFTLQGEGVIEAVVDECQAIRYSKMDNATAKSLSAQMHKNAVGILNGIINHYIGKDYPAVQFKPFGSASLRRVRIGMT